MFRDQHRKFLVGRRSAMWIACLAMPLAFSACSILGLRKQVGKLENQGTVALRVTPLPKTGVSTYAAALVRDSRGELQAVGLQQVRSDGFAVVYLAEGSSYTIAAFSDTNANRRFDPGEPFGLVRDVKPVSLASTDGHRKALSIELRPDNPDAPRAPMEIPPPNEKLGGKVDFATGDIASLDEPRFAPEGGGTGLWKPFAFLTDNKTGLYFTEAYDPKRTPVVFVYGIGGSPQDWKWMIEHFPRAEHQLWFFHYPSGMRLDRVAGSLAKTLALVQRQTGFRRCAIVAHSMGGLVCRAAINDLAANHPEVAVPRFVSVSTPWGGHSAAEAGVRRLKKPVPSWLDVTPGCEFLESLYRVPLPTETRHTLIYGRKTKRAPWLKGENDGTVEVASETDPRAVSGAVKVTELPYEHVEILSQPETLKLIRSGLR